MPGWDAGRAAVIRTLACLSLTVSGGTLPVCWEWVRLRFMMVRGE